MDINNQPSVRQTNAASERLKVSPEKRAANGYYIPAYYVHEDKQGLLYSKIKNALESKDARTLNEILSAWISADKFDIEKHPKLVRGVMDSQTLSDYQNLMYGDNEKFVYENNHYAIALNSFKGKDTGRETSGYQLYNKYNEKQIVNAVEDIKQITADDYPWLKVYFENIKRSQAKQLYFKNDFELLATRIKDLERQPIGTAGALKRNGIECISDLLEYTKKDTRRLRGIGHRGADYLDKVMDRIDYLSEGRLHEGMPKAELKAISDKYYKEIEDSIKAVNAKYEEWNLLNETLNKALNKKGDLLLFKPNQSPLLPNCGRYGIGDANLVSIKHNDEDILECLLRSRNVSSGYQRIPLADLKERNINVARIVNDRLEDLSKFMICTRPYQAKDYLDLLFTSPKFNIAIQEVYHGGMFNSLDIPLSSGREMHFCAMEDISLQGRHNYIYSLCTRQPEKKVEGSITHYYNDKFNVLFDRKSRFCLSPVQVKALMKDNIEEIDNAIKDFRENKEKLQHKAMYVVDPGELTDKNGMEQVSLEDIVHIAGDYLDNRINDDELDVDRIIEIFPHGSRLRGTAREDSDLDIVMFYTGKGKEDGLFNVLNDDFHLEINGIKVDINPIQVSENLMEAKEQIDRYKQKSMEYDNEIKSKENKSEVIQRKAAPNRKNCIDVEDSSVWYASVAFLQDSDTVQKIEELLSKERTDDVLTYVSNWDQGDEMSFGDTYKNPTHNIGDKIIAQDKYYTLLYNNSVGGSYELLRNVPVKDVRYTLQRGGYRGVDFPRQGTKDIQELATQMKAEDLATYKDKEKRLVEMLGPSFSYTYPVGHKFVLVDSETSLPHDIYGFYTGNGHLNFKFTNKKDNVPLSHIDHLTWDVLEEIVKEHKLEMDLMRNLPDNKKSVDLLLKNDTTPWQGYLGNLSVETLKDLRESLSNRNDYDEESLLHADSKQRKYLNSAMAIRKENMSQIQSELEKRLQFNFDKLGELMEDCEHYFTDWKGDESRLYNGNVDEEIRQMRTLHDEIPGFMKPQWINSEAIDGYEKTMHGVKFLKENKDQNWNKKVEMFAKLQGVTKRQSSSLLAISSAAVTLLSGINGIQMKSQSVSTDEEVGKYLRDRVDEGLSKGWFIVHVPDYFHENSNLRKTDFHDAVMFFSPQGIQHRILNKQQLDYAKEQNAIILKFNRNEFHDVYAGSSSDTEGRIKYLAKTSDDLEEELRKDTQAAKSNIIGSLNAIREGGHIFDNSIKSNVNATHAYECDILSSLGDLSSLNNHTYQYIAKELEGRDLYFTDTGQTVSIGKFHRDMEMDNRPSPSTRDYYETSMGTKQAFRIVEAYREGNVRMFEQMQWKMTPQQVEDFKKMLAYNKLSDGRKVDALIVYKEKNERKADYGKWRIYIQVGEQKMSRTMSETDINAYFHCETTAGKLAEKNFGEQLHLASFYQKFRFPEDADIEQVLLVRDPHCHWFVQADLGEKGKTTKALLSWNDKYALFTSKTATKEQLAARYLNKEISEMIAIGHDIKSKMSSPHNEIEEKSSYEGRIVNNQNSITMSKKKTQQVKQENASAVVQDKPQEKTVNEKVTQQTSTNVASNKQKEKSDEQVQHRPPQMVTVNGEKVTHAHAFQSNKSADDWFYTAKINGNDLRPQHMTAADVKAWQDRSLKVEDAMQHYFPTKLMSKAPKEEFKVYNKQEDGTLVPNLKLSDGRPLDKFSVFKEHREGKEDQGKYKMYAEVGNRKLTKVMSHEDLNAFFDRVSTPVKLVEKNFGEQLNLASAYAKYQIPESAGVEKVNLRKNKEGEWLVSAQGTFGKTEERPISKEDKYSLFHTKTATKEQIAAKVFQDGFTAKTEQKIAKSRALHR